MADIRPIPAIHYNPGASSDVGSRIAPPYDVIDREGRTALLGRDERNFVRIDLPHVPAKEAGPPAAYQGAADQLQRWLADGTLVASKTPALYLYHQHYRHGATDYIRKMFFARLRLEEFGKGSVFPHEQTFGGPKEDRLLLTKATKCNLSPIFGVFEDAKNAAVAAMEPATRNKPLLTGMLEGVENRLWAVSDPATIAQVSEIMRSKAIFIADGHHRYGTSLNYRAWLTQETGGISTDHPANFVLCVFCAMEDPGLLILPTHRVLAGLGLDAALFSGDANLTVADLNVSSADAAVEALAAHGPQAVGLFTARDGRYRVIRPKDAGLLDSLEPGHSPAWRRLGLAFLHAYLLDRRVTAEVGGGKPPEIHYVKAAAPAVDEARSTGGSVFLLQPTTMAEMRAVCSAGDLMPQKSTFFFPKLASGLIVNPLE